MVAWTHPESTEPKLRTSDARQFNYRVVHSHIIRIFQFLCFYFFFVRYSCLFCPILVRYKDRREQNTGFVRYKNPHFTLFAPKTSVISPLFFTLICPFIETGIIYRCSLFVRIFPLICPYFPYGSVGFIRLFKSLIKKETYVVYIQ